MHESPKVSKLSDHSMLLQLAENYRMFGRFVQTKHAAEAVCDELLGILGAIGKGAADRAERLVREHVAAPRVVVGNMLANGNMELKWVT